jgi:uncharacterized protein (DUF2384 family)
VISEKLEQLLVAIWGSVAVGWVWMQAPNPELDGATPYKLVEMGKTAVIEDLLLDMILGHPS